MSRRIVDPVNEPVLLDQVKANSGISHAEDDNLISDLVIPAARDYVEQKGRLALTISTWEQALDCFPATKFFYLDRWPGVSVVNIEYIDANGIMQVLPGTAYDIMAQRAPPTVNLTPGNSWPPTLAGALGTVRVVFDAGYGSDWTAVPKALHRAVLMLASYWYAQREAMVQGTVDRNLALSLDNLIRVGGGQVRYA